MRWGCRREMRGGGETPLARDKERRGGARLEPRSRRWARRGDGAVLGLVGDAPRAFSHGCEEERRPGARLGGGGMTTALGGRARVE